MQVRLVAFDGQQVVRGAGADEVVGVIALGMQSIGSHDGTGQVDVVQKR